MTQHHATTIKRTFKHLSDIDRGKLQAMYRSGLYTQKEIYYTLGGEPINDFSRTKTWDD